MFGRPCSTPPPSPPVFSRVGPRPGGGGGGGDETRSKRARVGRPSTVPERGSGNVAYSSRHRVHRHIGLFRQIRKKKKKKKKKIRKKFKKTTVARRGLLCYRRRGERHEGEAGAVSSVSLTRWKNNAHTVNDGDGDVTSHCSENSDDGRFGRDIDCFPR